MRNLIKRNIAMIVLVCLAVAGLTVPMKSEAANVGVKYRTHVQHIGNQAYVSDGTVSGTTGKSYRLEGIWIELTGSYSGSIQYKTHVQDYGWQNYTSAGTMSGTSGKSKRLEGISIKLTGKVANEYDVYYRVHCQDYGWLGWS